MSRNSYQLPYGQDDVALVAEGTERRFKISWKLEEPTPERAARQMAVAEELRQALERDFTEELIIEDARFELQFNYAQRSNKTMHTKFGVEQSEELDKSATETLRTDEGAVHCPQCANTVLPRESFGGLRVCPNCGTEPFERKP